MAIFNSQQKKFAYNLIYWQWRVELMLFYQNWVSMSNNFLFCQGFPELPLFPSVLCFCLCYFYIMRKHATGFPNSFKIYRRMMGYSQKEVAKVFGFKSPSRISRWEKGEAMPSVSNLFLLSILYKTLPAQLYDELLSTTD